MNQDHISDSEESISIEDEVGEALTPVTHPDTSLGNTSTKLVKRVRGRCWCFTLNNYTDDTVDTILLFFRKNKKTKYIFQEEIAPKTLTPHLQGAVYFTNARSFDSLKRILPKGIHLERAKGTWQQNIDYCTKSDTRKENGKVWSKGVPKRVEDPLAGRKPYAWQSRLLSKLALPPHPRHILWIYDVAGNTGKTSFCKHVLLNDDRFGTYCYVSGKANDVKYAVGEICESDDVCGIFFDYSRSKEEYISYEAIESIKNGIFFTTKYKSRTVLLNTPHIVCFANYPPKREKLSVDRWIIYQIIDFKLNKE